MSLLANDYIFRISAITTGKEILRVVILDTKQTEYGEVNLPVDQLADQSNHEGNLDLQTASGGPASGTISLNLQWIHSTVKYLKEIILRWDDHIQTTFADMRDYETDLKALYEPFRTLKGLKDVRKSTPQVQSLAQSRTPSVTQISGSESFIKWQTYGFYATIIMLVFAFLAGFVRNTFLDVKNSFAIQN